MGKGMKLWSVLIILTLASCLKLTAQSATQSQMEKSDSEKDVKVNETANRPRNEFGVTQASVQGDRTTQGENYLDLERIMEIAEEEIERTSQEAVKAALIEVGGELAYWKERSDLFEAENERLKLDLKQAHKSQKKIKTQWLWNGIAIGVGVSGIVCGVVALCVR